MQCPARISIRVRFISDFPFKQLIDVEMDPSEHKGIGLIESLKAVENNRCQQII